MPQTDIEKRKEYNRKYYETNKFKKMCEHNRRKSQCKECGGSSICEHNKRKSTCKECGGSSICEHGREKSKCKECGGSSICEHGREKSKCKECGGSSICEHNRIKSYCKECGGSCICEHNRIKSTCKECGGSCICEHNRIKRACKECNFTLYLVNLQRNNLRRCLNNSNLEKTKPSIEYLGCDIIYFKNYIESKMVNAMTWDNIHLDHIKPVSKFNLNDHEEFLQCCNYSNFQPLLSEDNLSKNDKWSDEYNKFWFENIQGKEYRNIYLSK